MYNVPPSSLTIALEQSLCCPLDTQVILMVDEPDGSQLLHPALSRILGRLAEAYTPSNKARSCEDVAQ